MTRYALVLSSSLWLAAGLLLFAHDAHAQTTQELQQRIQQMKQLYEQQISALEGHIPSIRL